MNVYVQLASDPRKPIKFPSKEKRFLVLIPNGTWNDFGHQTAFEAYLAIGETWTRLDELKVAVAKSISAHGALGTGSPVTNAPKTYRFEISGRFISLGQSIHYYQSLKDALTEKELESLLITLNDVVYLEYRHPKSPNLSIRKDDIFRVSLLRKSEAMVAYGAAKDILFPKDLSATRFNFGVEVSLGAKKESFKADFVFSAEKDDLPTNIVVVIGRNGLGKTRLLYTIREVLCSSPQLLTSPNEHPPAFREVIAVSYSPFERFPTGTTEATNQTASYRYCGFRNTDGHWAYNVAEKSLGNHLTFLIKDHFTGAQTERPRLTLLITALSAGLHQATASAKGLQQSRLSIARHGKVLELSELLKHPNLLKEIETNPIETDHLVFDGVPFTGMSAGQKMFVLVGTTICASIQSNSLLLVDEPELYLHPTLEAEYFKMLKALLNLFESYAIIATHSVFIAREVPERNVLVLREGPGSATVVGNPKIPTFGGDLNLIADYVFDNTQGSKAYEQSLDGVADHAEKYEDVLKKYEGTLGLESLAYIRQRMSDRSDADAAP
jgi:energy-coupling factor transporter ATP-binding protein EcfA2